MKSTLRQRLADGPALVAGLFSRRGLTRPPATGTLNLDSVRMELEHALGVSIYAS